MIEKRYFKITWMDGKTTTIYASTISEAFTPSVIKQIKSWEVLDSNSEVIAQDGVLIYE